MNEISLDLESMRDFIIARGCTNAESLPPVAVVHLYNHLLSEGVSKVEVDEKNKNDSDEDEHESEKEQEEGDDDEEDEEEEDDTIENGHGDAEEVVEEEDTVLNEPTIAQKKTYVG